jgi:AAA domain
MAWNPGADLSDVQAELARIAVAAPRETGRLGQLRAALLDSPSLDSIKPPQPVIDGLLYRDGLAWLYGKPATYKSFIALDWAGCVSTGLPWQEHETAHGSVLYLIAEGTAGLRKRVRAWEDYADCTMLATFLPVAVQLLNPADLAAFAALVAELDPVLVVIDTQARVTVGADENSTMEMGRLVAAADKIRAVCQACVLIVHHEPRGGENMRGSIALEGAATSLFRAERDESRITLKNIRQRDVPEADDVVLHAVPRLESVVMGSNAGDWRPAQPSASEAAILQALSDIFLETGASASVLIKATKLPDSTFYNAVKGLVKRGEVVSNGTRNRSHYELPPKGSLQLSPMDSNSNDAPVSNLQPPFKGVGDLETTGEPGA